MINIVDRIPINADQCANILSNHTNRVGLFIDIDRCLDYHSYFQRVLFRDYKIFRAMSGNDYITAGKREEVALIAVKKFGVDPKLFMGNGEKFSLDSETRKSLIESDEVSQDAKEYFEVYNRIKDAEVVIENQLAQYLRQPVLTKMKSFEGHRMALARPTWKVLSTSRISASAPSLQNINRMYLDIITYPEGWALIRSDSGQIEPRITYSHYIQDQVIQRLIELYDDAYFGLQDYITRDMDVLDKAYRDPSILEKVVLDKEDRPMLKLLVLAGQYGSGLESLPARLSIPFKERVIQNPRRLSWLQKVEDEVSAGATSFRSAFGTIVTPDATEKYKKGEGGWKKHLVRCGVNNPIQTTASDLMCASVYEADKIIKNKARNNSAIAYYKHDEGAFYLEGNDIDLADELAECMSYNVTLNGKKWIPVYGEKKIGKPEGKTEVPVY